MAKNPKRFLVKVSGEALAGEGGSGIDPATLERIGADIAEAARERQIAVIVGGGNIFRGIQGLKRGIERNTGDSMGRLATVINALALADAVRSAGGKAVALSADPMPSLCRTYYQRGCRPVSLGRPCRGHRRRHRTALLHHRHRGGPSRRELDCAAVLKATNVDGVYTADPARTRRPAATTGSRTTKPSKKQLGVMDTAAFALARENALPIIVFSIQTGTPSAACLRGAGRRHVVPSARD